MPRKVENLTNLFVHILKDILYAEYQIQKVLPKIIRKTGDGKLRGLFEDYLDETDQYIGRLQEAFAFLDKKTKDMRCPAIDGIIYEVEELILEIDDPDTCDTVLIAAVQVIQKYKTTRYGTLCVWAEQLGHKDVKNLLQQTLSEEENANDKLTQIAKNKTNKQAAA